MSGMEEVGEGESRVLPASRRPDGTYRKPVRIRAGYTPQEEVAIYQSKGSQFRKGALGVPPGYDPVEDASPKLKTKSAKRNEKRKEKRLQVAASASDATSAQRISGEEVSHERHSVHQRITNIACQTDKVVELMGSLTVAESCALQNDNKVLLEKPDLEKRIRALRKKIRTAEALQETKMDKKSLSAEELDKVQKLVLWQQELRELLLAAE